MYVIFGATVDTTSLQGINWNNCGRYSFAEL